MQISKKYLLGPLQKTLHTLEKHRLKTPFLLDALLILFHFFQVISYFFNVYNVKSESYSFCTIRGVFYYTNPANLLNFLGYQIVTQVIYVIANCLIYLPIVILISFFMLFTIKTKTRDYSQTLIFILMAKFLVWFFYLQFWLLFLPFNDIFLSAFQTSTPFSGFSLLTTSNPPLYIYIFSIIAIAFNIMLAFFGLWLRRSVHFLDDRSLNCHAQFSGYMALLLRILISLLLPFYINMDVVFDVLLHIFLIHSIYYFVLDLPIRNQKLCRFYAAILFLSESVAINLTTYRVSNAISEDGLFYMVVFLGVLAYKGGLKVFEVLYGNMVFIQKLPQDEKVLYYLEEMYYCLEKQCFSRNECLLFGLLRAHLKACDSKECHYMKKNIIDKNILPEKAQYLVNKVIIAKFTNLITVNSKNLSKLSLYLVKFMSFLSIADVNSVKCYYEIQKVMNYSKIQGTSFFLELIFETLRAKIKTKIRGIRTQKTQNEEAMNAQKSQISPEAFFKITKTQNTFEKRLKELLQAKRVFWENYEKGVNSSEELIGMGIHLSRQLNRFLIEITPGKELSTHSPLYLLRVKYLSIFHCILSNKMNKASKYEEEYEGMVLKTQTVEGLRILQNLSFLDPDIVTCLVSYLKAEGDLKEEYKTDKLAQFFGYSGLEFRSIHSLGPLMPYYINKYHNSFVTNFLRKSKKELEESQQSLDTFALNKKDFVFPIRIFLGFNFDYKDDFVLMGALMKVDDKDILNWLLDDQGNTIGVSETFFAFLKKQHAFINKNDLPALNALSLCPEIQTLVEEFKKGKQDIYSYGNQSSWLTLPEKMKDLLTYINAINKEEGEIKKNTETRSFKSMKTVKSNRTEISHRSTTFKMPKILGTITSRERAFEGCENAQDYKLRVYTMFLASSVCRRFLMTYDLNIQRHWFGPEDGDNILVIQIKIRKMESENDTISKKMETRTDENNSYFFRKNLDSSKMMETAKNYTTKNMDSTSDIKGLESEIKGLDGMLPLENETNFKNIFGKTFLDASMDMNPLSSMDMRPLPSSEDRYGKNQPVNNNTQKVQDKRDSVIKVMKFNPNDSVVKTILDNPLPKLEKLLDKNEGRMEFLGNLQPMAKVEVSDSSKERRAVLNDNVRKSHRSSSVIGTKTTHLIYNAIDSIQKSSPRPLKLVSASLLFEVVMIMIFFAVLYILYDDYVKLSYEPTQSSMINYCRLATSLSYTTAMFTELEYHNLNITTRVPNSMKLKLWDRIIQDNYNTMKSLNFHERNMPGNIKYQEIFKSVSNLFIDYQTLAINTWKYSDTLDFIVDLIYSSSFDFGELLTKNEIVILQRNYPYVLPSTSTVLLAVQNDFNESNTGTTTTAMNVMLVFLIVSMVTKLFQTIQFLDFHKRICHVLSIFRRVNIQDSFNERNFCTEVSLVLQHPFLRFSFVEKSQNKRVFTLEDGPNSGYLSSNSKTVKKSATDRKPKGKLRAKSGFYNVKPLPITKIIFLMTMLTTWSVIYYFFNYYFWISNNQNINNLITINIFFINVYIYSTSIVGFNTLALRERVVRNPEFEALNNTYQQHNVRLGYFYDNLVKRLYLIGNITANSLPKYTLQAKTSILNDDFDELVERNICDVLLRLQFIDQDELNFCENSFDGSFQRGILNLVNNFIIQIKHFQVYTEVLTDPNKTQSQYEQVKDFINSQPYEDFMYSYYYYQHSLLLYYNYINGYYKALMDQEMNKLYSFLIATSVVSGFLIFVLALLLKKKLEEYYRFVTLMLSLIPHEKVINDEQTKFLINNFLKKI